MSVPREMALSARTYPRVHPEARIFIAVAWASKYDIQIFRLFPEVFHADSCTCDSNVTGNSLLTFSCHTSTGKQVVFLKIWIPNQKRFSFRWVFTFVLISLTPASVIEDLVNGARAEISSATSRKRNIDNCQTVDVNVEEK
jgi:hypothetical protein